MMRKTHLPVMTRAYGGLSTRVQVRLASSASNSACMAVRQFGSFRASRAEVGIGDSSEVVAVMAYFGFGLNTPALPRVVMWCTG